MGHLDLRWDDSQVAVTIRDVARQAQVSVSTVSRALSAPGLVKEATRQRVLDVVRGLGYQPNRAARSLITGRTGNLGIVVPDPVLFEFREEFLRPLVIEVFDPRAATRRHDMELFRVRFEQSGHKWTPLRLQVS